MMKRIVYSVMIGALCLCGAQATPADTAFGVGTADGTTFDTLTQETLPAEQAAEEKGLHMVGAYQNNKVYLRWAASTYPLWKRMMEEGVILERYEFNAARYAPPVRRQIPIMPFLRQDTARLSAMAQTDEYAAILGEAVYSPDLQLHFAESGGAAADNPDERADSLPGRAPDWLALKTQMEQEALRFVLANLACDRSFPVACFGGMGYVDDEVQAGKYYLYRLYLPADSARFANSAGDPSTPAQAMADTAFFFTRLEKTSTLGTLPVAELQTEFKDGRVTLSWPHSPAGEPCVGYFIERAAGTARKFVRLNMEIYADFVQDASHRVAYIDSLPDSKTDYRYRVLARDLFGNERVVAMSHPGRDTAYLHALPRLDSLHADKKGERVFWSFPEEEQDRVAGYALYALSAPSDNLPDEPLVASIPPDYRSCLLPKNQIPPTAYLYLAAYGKNGESKVSLPLFRQQEDSVPPVAPAHLRAEVDSTGVLCLRWTPVPDRDCSGYRVYMKLTPQGEYVQLTTHPLADTLFTDTLSLITGQKFYYAVGAVDTRGNHSELSEWVGVNNGLPRPPVPPVFDFDCPNDGKGVELRWQNSPSTYLCGQILSYKVDSSDWVVLKDYTKNKPDETLPQSFYFKFPASLYSRRYSFRLSAYGEDKEKDTVSAPFLHTVDHSVRLTAPHPTLLADRERHFVHLQWKNAGRGDVRKLCVYRRDNQRKLFLLATLTGEDARQGYYVDAQVRMNTDYAYCLQFQYADGTWSKISSEAEIQY